MVMKWIAAALIASAGVPIARAVWANRLTTLSHTMGWVIVAWFTWISAAIVGTAPTRYLALVLTACAGVGVLGARRPGVGAWNAVVGGLLVVLLVPLASGHVTYPPVLGGTIYSYFLLVVLLVGVGNYLPTRAGISAAALLAGIGIEMVADDFKIGGFDHVVAAGLLAAGPWLAWLDTRERSNDWKGDRLWRDFRDRFGVVWAQRLREQFNAAAANAKLSVELGWSGLRRADGAQLSDEERVKSLDLLHALMTRFGLA
jgi:hypothetical protein